jgi:threonine/homoserine/homoserine lactone efflux protein
MQWIGVAWLSYLAWHFARRPARSALRPKNPVSNVGAAGLQWINPKTWMMALAVVSVFAGVGENRLVHVFCLSLRSL